MARVQEVPTNSQLLELNNEDSQDDPGWYVLKEIEARLLRPGTVATPCSGFVTIGDARLQLQPVPHRPTDGKTDRQTDRRTETQPQRRTNSQTQRQTDRQSHGRTDVQNNLVFGPITGACAAAIHKEFAVCPPHIRRK